MLLGNFKSTQRTVPCVTQTGFYYLQSRYYDPVVQRFLNADGLISTGQGILGYNMFAYCGNNPVNYCDPSGNSFWSTLLNAGKKFLKNFVKDYSAPKIKTNSNTSGLSINDFKNIDGTVSVYDSRRHLPADNPFFEQAIWGGIESPSMNPPNLVTVKGGLYRGAGDYEYGRFDYSVAEGSAKVGFSKNEFGVYAKATGVKGSIAGKINTPLGTLIIGGEANFFSIGAGIALTTIESGFKLRMGYSYGWGADLIIEWVAN